MTKTIDKKVGVTDTLRKVMFPLGIVTSVVGFVWFIIYTSGTSSTDAKFVSDMLKASRYIAIPFIFLALVIGGMIIAHAVLQLTKLNKTNVKNDLVPGIINAVVGLLIFIFFILAVTKVFNETKWFTGEYAYKNIAFMGILSALVLFVSVFAAQFNKSSLNSKNNNIKMLRTIGVATFVIALCNILSIGMVVAGGFVNISDEATTRAQMASSETASLTVKFVLASVGTIAFLILAMIPMSILGIGDKVSANKQVIAWSVTGGITFILFVIAAAMIKSDLFDIITSWTKDHTTITVFCLLGWISSLVAGTIAFTKTKAFAPKIAKAPK